MIKLTEMEYDTILEKGQEYLKELYELEDFDYCNTYAIDFILEKELEKILEDADIVDNAKIEAVYLNEIKNNNELNYHCSLLSDDELDKIKERMIDDGFEWLKETYTKEKFEKEDVEDILDDALSDLIADIENKGGYMHEVDTLATESIGSYIEEKAEDYFGY